MNKISIIIPTLNEEKYLGNLLNDLKKQNCPPFEIIVVDGYSEDRTEKIAKKNNVKFYKAKKSPAEQRTFGGKRSQGNYLVFLDADVRVEKNFLENVFKIITKSGLEIACPFYFPYKSVLLIDLIYVFFNAIFFILQNLLPSGAGSCIVVNKKLFSKVNGFDSSLTYDDIAFIRSASKLGSFQILPFKVFVSDRRFKKYGILKTFLQYILLSVFFILGKFKSANLINYKFGGYNEK